MSVSDVSVKSDFPEHGGFTFSCVGLCKEKRFFRLNCIPVLFVDFFFSTNEHVTRDKCVMLLLRSSVRFTICTTKLIFSF